MADARDIDRALVEKLGPFGVGALSPLGSAVRRLAREQDAEPYRGVAALFEGDSDVRGERADWAVESSVEITYNPDVKETKTDD